jgi:hypothetical protein
MRDVSRQKVVYKAYISTFTSPSVLIKLNPKARESLCCLPHRILREAALRGESDNPTQSGMVI